MSLKLLTLFDKHYCVRDGHQHDGQAQTKSVHSGILACRDIPCLPDQPGSRICRILDPGEPNRAERRRIVAQVRRILSKYVSMHPRVAEHTRDRPFCKSVYTTPKFPRSSTRYWTMSDVAPMLRLRSRPGRTGSGRHPPARVRDRTRSPRSPATMPPFAHA